MTTPQSDGDVHFEQFLKLDLRVGTVVSARPNERARVPCYVLDIDFGPLGVKTSSAQLTERYAAADLVGRQVVAVVNFAPKRVADVASEVLVLAALDELKGTTLLGVSHPVADGSRIA